MNNRIPWTHTSDAYDVLWEGSQGQDLENVPDMLETMYAKQRQHLEAYQQINPEAYLDPSLWGQLNDPRTQAAIRENAGYVVEELYEAIGILKNKPWKQTLRTLTPEQHAEFREELADVWHFFIQLHIVAGMNPLDIFQEYFRKALVNHERQNGGY